MLGVCDEIDSAFEGGIARVEVVGVKMPHSAANQVPLESDALLGECGNIEGDEVRCFLGDDILPCVIERVDQDFVIACQRFRCAPDRLAETRVV